MSLIQADIHMIETLEMLEFIQCVLAKLLAGVKNSVMPVLINQTGFVRIQYRAPSAELQLQIQALLKPAVQVAQHNLVIILSLKEHHLQFNVLTDDNVAPIVSCTTPDKVKCSQPLIHPARAIQLQSDNTDLTAAIRLLNTHSAINFTSSSTEHTEQLTLVNCRQAKNTLPQQPMQIPVLTLSNDTLKPELNNALFWPFFDTDIVLITQTLSSSAALTVLIADDSIPSKVATQVMLEKLGCKVTSASNGNEALSLAQQQLFDLILLDERMPGLNGSDVAHHLSKTGQVNCNTPKVALTGITHPDEIDILFRKGVTHYLEKPITKLILERFLQPWQLKPMQALQPTHQE